MTTGAESKRQFCRKGIHNCVPAVTLEFEGGGRLHWCAEHAADADEYRVERAVCRHDRRPIARRTDRGPQAKWFHNDDRGGRGCADGTSEAEPLIIDADSFYTPAAGDADRYNELGDPSGYVHRSAG